MLCPKGKRKDHSQLIRAQDGEPGNGGQKVEMKNTSLALPED